VELIINGMYYLLLDFGSHTRRENGDIVLLIGHELRLDAICDCDTIDTGRKVKSFSIHV